MVLLNRSDIKLNETKKNVQNKQSIEIEGILQRRLLIATRDTLNILSKIFVTLATNEINNRFEKRLWNIYELQITANDET